MLVAVRVARTRAAGRPLSLPALPRVQRRIVVVAYTAPGVIRSLNRDVHES